MDHYHTFIADLDRLEKNPVMPNRSTLVAGMKRQLDKLLLSLNYQKLKSDPAFGADFIREDGLVFKFFDSTDIREAEKKLNHLRKRLMEVMYMYCGFFLPLLTEL